MTLGRFLSQMGVAPKLADRYSHVEYGEPAHDPHHQLYAYEPHEHHDQHDHQYHHDHRDHHDHHDHHEHYDPHAHAYGHVASSKHHHYGGHGHKSNAAMSALTLLSFLFFLHILQQCLRDHMAAMNANPTVVVMSGSKEGDESIAKTANIDKFDKAGNLEAKAKSIAEENVKSYEENATKENAFDNFLTRISTADYTPSIGGVKYKRILNKNRGNTSLSYAGFVNAMTDQ